MTGLQLYDLIVAKQWMVNKNIDYQEMFTKIFYKGTVEPRSITVPELLAEYSQYIRRIEQEHQDV